MRVGVYDPKVHMCSNCLVWERRGLSQEGKALGFCRRNAPVVTSFRHVIPEPGSNRIGIQEAQTTAFPTTTADMSCYEHVVDQGKLQ